MPRDLKDCGLGFHPADTGCQVRNVWSTSNCVVISLCGYSSNLFQVISDRGYFLLSSACSLGTSLVPLTQVFFCRVDQWFGRGRNGAHSNSWCLQWILLGTVGCSIEDSSFSWVAAFVSITTYELGICPFCHSTKIFVENLVDQEE